MSEDKMILGSNPIELGEPLCPGFGHIQDDPLDDKYKEQLEEVLEKLQVEKNNRDEQMGDGEDGSGQRLNKGKLRMELTPPEWEIALADVSTKGSLKYEARNWEKGMGWASMIGCMKRHINKFLAGERYDGEEFDLDKGTTGCHHLAMVAWNALALMSYDLRQIGTNDFPKDSTMQLFLRVNAETSDMGGDIHEQ